MINGMTIDGKAVKEISIDGKLWWANAPATIVFADAEVLRVLTTVKACVDYIDQSNPGSLGYVDRNGDGKIGFDEAASCGSLLEVASSGLTIFTFKDKIKSFNEFKWFKGLKTLIRMFYGCSALTTVELPVPNDNSTDDLGSYTFYQCASLHSIIIPEGWGNIGTRFASRCTSLNLIDIPSTCTSIKAELLYNSMTPGSPHTTIVCRAETPPAFGGYGSEGKPLAVYVPDQSVQAYKSASGWKEFASDIKPLSTYIE